MPHILLKTFVVFVSSLMSKNPEMLKTYIHKCMYVYFSPIYYSTCWFAVTLNDMKLLIYFLICLHMIRFRLSFFCCLELVHVINL